MNQDMEQEMLAFWKESWEKNGWETRVLGMSDAKAHPLYEELVAAQQREDDGINPPGYELNCMVRHLAMASAGGGWHVDYDVFNFNFRASEQCENAALPNSGELTIYQNIVPAVMSGSASEYSRLGEFFIRPETFCTNWAYDFGHVSDMTMLS
eukprot:CAMPEP_0168475628 /NCGR_PEP_ID=MMETSP0228-20121227/61461_1 /TAXON_ID=133427 /ORGANISM="Protoceratium reticulatum, Strain CCCM 535 (=CCMP 1889)" /LENGTH=152 /DNA_ID=CAMNT_0008491705 /DNA_START=121 /DNA_END=576 /DNA_ORIENTATION=+